MRPQCGRGAHVAARPGNPWPARVGRLLLRQLRPYARVKPLSGPSLAGTLPKARARPVVGCAGSSRLARIQAIRRRSCGRTAGVADQSSRFSSRNAMRATVSNHLNSNASLSPSYTLRSSRSWPRFPKMLPKCYGMTLHVVARSADCGQNRHFTRNALHALTHYTLNLIMLKPFRRAGRAQISPYSSAVTIRYNVDSTHFTVYPIP